MIFDPPLSLLVVSPGGSRPSPSFPGPSSGLWPLGVGYPWLPCTASIPSGLACAWDQTTQVRARKFPGAPSRCYCADVVSILSPPWQPNVYMAKISRPEASPGQAKSFLMIYGTVAKWYCWMPFPLCLPLSLSLFLLSRSLSLSLSLSRRRCRAEEGHPLSELLVLSRGVSGVTTRQA